MMARFNSSISLMIWLIIGGLLLGCQPKANNLEGYAMHQPRYILHFGLQGIKDFAQYNQGEVDRHPSGAGFRELDFSPPHLGQITVDNAAHSLVLEHVFSVLGTSFNSAEGIQKLRINAGLNKEEFVSPEQAYQAYVALMKGLNQAGWKNYFLEGMPRVAKEDNMRYLMEWGYVIDPSYIFSYEEWQKIISTRVGNSFGYRLYVNGILLNLSIQRTEKTPEGKEQYMLRYAFETIRYDQRNSMDDAQHNISTDRMTPQELEQAFKERLTKYQSVREQEEKEAKAKGYRIDESYVDPDVWQYVR